MGVKREVPIASPQMGEAEWQAMRQPLERGWLAQGPEVAAFEREFAEAHAVSHAVAVSSGTTGLHCALLAAGVGPGHDVVVPSFTWIATANAVLYCGANPVFADVDPRTCNVSAEEVHRRLTPQTRAVVPVHLFGLCAEVEAIREGLPDGVHVVEDAACAAGARGATGPAGSLGDLGVFSFHPRKSITTGEGGMVTTHDRELAERLSRLRSHGASVSDAERQEGPRPHRMPDFAELGFNYRMTDLQAALGRVQLEKLEAFVTQRGHWADRYRRELADLAWLRCPEPPAKGRHAWQAFVTHVDPARAPVSRNELMERLSDRGVATRPGTHAVHTLGIYRKTSGLAPEDLPHALDLHENSMAIPLHNGLDDEDVAYVVDAIRSVTA